MKGLDYSDFDPELEDELRATLRRRAADVSPNPPDWRDLLRRSEAVVVSLHTGRPMDDVPAHGPQARRRRDWTWLRPALAAAACLAVVMAAGIVVGRSTGSDHDGGTDPAEGDTDTDEAAPDHTLPTPGDQEFAVATAPPLIDGTPDEVDLQTQVAASSGLPQELQWMSTPESAADMYLEEVGLASVLESGYGVWTDPPSAIEEVVTDDARVETTTVWWSVRLPQPRGVTGDPPVATMGRVFLRNLTSPADTDSPDAWTVVGARTQGLDLANVTRHGDQLRFTITAFRGNDADVDPDAWPVEVRVNDEVLDDPADVVPRTPTEFVHEIPADQPAKVTIRQFAEPSGAPLSVTETTFVPQIEQTPTPTMPTTSDDVAAIPDTGVPEGFGIAVLNGCAPDIGLVVAMDLPVGFSTEAAAGEPNSEVPASPVCVFHFSDVQDPRRTMTVGWNEPPFEVPELQGATCFRWAALDDGGFVAVREQPLPLYVTGSGLTEAEFDRAISSSVLTGSERWAADEGCG
ncbi:MAG: hypothetical protein ACRD2C_11450 [Acidimicrobiales bacterium]